jgi:hypothetical protein
MADPTKDKTWEFDLNNQVLPNTSQSGNAMISTQSRLFSIKEILINNGATTFTKPWIVQESSDSVTAGGTAYGSAPNDKWLERTNLVWRQDGSGSIFSWIVLRQTGISTKFELLIVCEQDNNSYDGKEIIVYVAQNGFRLADGGTDGTTTARPSATDERRLRNYNEYWGSGAVNTAYTSQHHVWMSSDGECTRIAIFIANVVTGFWAFEKPKNPTTGWTDPYFAVIRGESNVGISNATYTMYYDNARMLGKYSGADTTMFLTGEGTINDALGEATNPGFTTPVGLQTPNQLDGTYTACEMGIASQTATFQGHHGNVFDMWWGFSLTQTGRYYPEGGTKAFVQIDDFIMPWDGSTLIRTR